MTLSVLPTSYTEPTLCTQNLSDVIKDVKNMDMVAYYLRIPDIIMDEIRSKAHNKCALCQELSTYYINHVPGASWLMMACALWFAYEYDSLQIVGQHYLRGM